MKKILGLVPLFALTIMFVQCTGNSKRANTVAMESHKTIHIHYDSIISMERLKEIGIDRNTLLKHIELQENAWNGGDFRDDSIYTAIYAYRDRFSADYSLGKILSFHPWLQATFYRVISRKNQVCFWISVENG